jgi:hypothetical protein
MLFNSRAPSCGRVLHIVSMKDGDYVIEAGAAHGITVGAELLIYPDQDLSLKTAPSGTLVARDVTTFYTTMDYPPNAVRFALVTPAFALQSMAGTEEDLRLHVATDDRFAGLFEALTREMEDSSPHRKRILLVEKSHAELDIDFEDGHVVFNILNPLVTKYGLVRMPFQTRPDLDQISPILHAAAHFHWHLRRHGTSTIRDGVQIEFKALEYNLDDAYNLIHQPTDPDLNMDGVIDVVVDSDSIYGIKIINNSMLPLYPSLFFFDNSDLSIRKSPWVAEILRLIHTTLQIPITNRRLPEDSKSIHLLRRKGL